MTLGDDLRIRANGCARVARANYYAAYVFLAIGVVASAWASIAIASGNGSKELNAALAAVSGVIVLVTNTFKFAPKSDWWWAKYHRLDALHRRLTFEDGQPKDVSRELSAVVRDLEKVWPGFGSPPADGEK